MFRENADNDRKRDNCEFKDQDIRIQDSDLYALVFELPKAVMAQVKLI